MTIPTFTMKQLIEAGVHFGHKTSRWNPQMAPYIYGVRNKTHIMDLGKTAPMLHQALSIVHQVAEAGGKILFVATKRQASSIIADAAKNCEQYYINARWLGGLLTNWQTIKASIKRMGTIEENLENNSTGLTKKEMLGLQRQYDKLEKSLGGIRKMDGSPDLIFIIDTNKESLALAEAKTLDIPVVAIVDSNSSLENINYPVPGNDDSTRAIQLYCDLVSKAVIEGCKNLKGKESDIDFASMEKTAKNSMNKKSSKAS